MAFQAVLTKHDTQKAREIFAELYNDDRDMFDFVVGLLFHWTP
jgi:hypothetical protein